MIRSKVLLAILFFLAAQVSAQDPSVDSLKNVLMHTTEDTTRANTLRHLAETADEEEWPRYNSELNRMAEQQLMRADSAGTLKNFYLGHYAATINNFGYLASLKNNNAEALNYYLQSLKIREEVSDTNGILESLNNLAFMYINNDLDKSLQYYKRMLIINKKIRNVTGANSALNNIGLIFARQGEIKKALECYEVCIRISAALGNKNAMSSVFNNSADIYLKQGIIPKALEYNFKSLKLNEELGDKEAISYSLNNIGIVYSVQGDLEKALEFYNKSLLIRKSIGDDYGIAKSLNNIGNVYQQKKEVVRALDFYMKSLAIRETINDKLGEGESLISIGNVYKQQGDLEKARQYFDKSRIIYEETGDKTGIAQSLAVLGTISFERNEREKALKYFSRSMDISRKLGFPELIRTNADFLSRIYTATGNFRLALENYNLFVSMRDSINNEEAKRASIKSQFKYDFDKRELELKKEQEKRDAISRKEIEKQKLIRNGSLGGLALVLISALVFFRQRNRIRKEKRRSDELLLNILPAETAEELKTNGTAEAKYMESVTVIFTDFKDFTANSERLGPRELVAEINEYFASFDRIMEKHGVEKIKTIGDSYMAAGGLPTTNSTHPIDVVMAAFEIKEFMTEINQRKSAEGKLFFEIRIGIHTGPVVAGIVGIHKFQYDIWGDTVNTASRLENAAEPGMINISAATYDLVKERFTCIHRGNIEVKGKGEVAMYYVEGEK